MQIPLPAFRHPRLTGRVRGRFSSCFLVLVALAFTIPCHLGPSAWADEPEDAAPSEKSNDDSKLNRLLEMLSQPGDDKLDSIPSETESNEDEANRRKAVAHYMTGRTMERANKFQEAYQAYKNALEIDPKSIAIYRSIIPLAFRLDKIDEGIQYARKAVELDPNNFELLSQLGIYALRQRNVASSIEYFEKAVESQTVDKKAGPYISIMSQLGQLYLTLNKTEEAARSFAIVFEAITNPNDYSLDFRTQRALETLQGNKAETFESFGELFLMTDRNELAERAFKLAAESSRTKPEVYSYHQARMLLKKGDKEAALDRLQKYFDAKLETKGKGPYLLLTELLIALDREDEIIPRLEKLVENNPRNDTLRLYLAERYITAENLESAEEIYQELKDSEKQDEIQLGLLKIYRQQNKPAETLQALTQAMMAGANSERLEAELDLISQDKELANRIIELGRGEDQPEDERAAFTQSYLTAKLAMQQERVEDVLALYFQAMEIRGERQIQVTLYAELIDYLESIEHYEDLIEVIQKAIDSPTLVAERQAFQLQLIQTYVAAEETEAAIELIEQVQESDPDNLMWEYQKGRVYYLSEDWEEASEIFAEVLADANASTNAAIIRDCSYNLSRSLTFMGMPEDALKLIDRTIENEPRELLWRFQKGWINYYTHNWDAAIKAFEDLLELEIGSPNDTIIRQARFSLSAAYVQNKQYDKGEKILEEYYEQNPDDTSVCNDLGYLYADRGKKLEQAREMIEKALKAEPENNAYLDSMGWVLFKLGKYEEALTYLEKAVEDSDDGDAVLFDHLGDCYDALGKTDKARDAWKKALKQERDAKFSNQELIETIESKLKGESDS
ncbi:tetratricopeptide repeat protein [Rubinisphaera margarita]|uniref:tetratricopeptide repeat protein n=1 Tax=Rubinisphaera margarita TaxID=2909586 RepID=UPI001EE7BD86|nr:tetratricopeptide repeat protein [Rubinisphaera margarita]MCG6154200.1 tetratricopeptide repeat protein [Rubinisphaera margarita]